MSAWSELDSTNSSRMNARMTDIQHAWRELIFPRIPWLVALAYAAASAVWIFFSDKLLVELALEFSHYQMLQTYKGWAFAVISAVLILQLLRWAWKGMLSAYQATTRSERLLNLALSSARGGVWEIDLAQGGQSVILVSAELRSRLGLDPVAPLTTNTLKQLRHPEDRVEVERKLKKAISSGGEVPYSARYRLRTADGSYVWVQSSGSVVSSSQGEPGRMLGVALDVSAQVEAGTCS